MNTTSVISVDDIEFLAQQSDSNINMIVAGMTSIIQSNETKTQAMENQNWFQRMCRTISGKNKMTAEEIRKNHDKLNSYMTQALTELYNRNKIQQEILISFGNKINEIYASQIQLKQMLGMFAQRLKEKIESVDNFHMLITEIEQGLYDHENTFISMCKVLSQLDKRTLLDSRKMNILENTLRKHNIITDDEHNILDYLQEIVNLPETEIGLIYLELSGVEDNIIACMIVSVIESYHLLPAMSRKLKKKELVVQSILTDYELDDSVSLSVGDIYSELLQIKTNSAENSNIVLSNDSQNAEIAEISEPVESESEQIEKDEITSDKTEEISIKKEENIQSKPKLEKSKSPDKNNINEYHIRDDVNTGALLEFKDKHIFFENDIICDGTLSFDNCIIEYYVDNNTIKGIKLKDGASIKIKNSTIVCSGYANVNSARYISDDMYFIVNEYSNNKILNINFIETTFKNCAAFINDVPCRKPIVFENCQIINPSTNFINNKNDAELLIKDSVIQYDNDQIYKQMQKEKISFSNNEPTIYSANGMMENCYIEASKCSKHEEESSPLINIKNVKNCTFNKISNCITAANINNSLFIDCCYATINVLETIYCNFYDCENVMLTGKYKSRVTNCQFVNCKKRVLLNTNQSITISNCQFINLSRDEDGSLFLFRVNDGGYDGWIIGKVENCKFDGINLTANGYNYLFSSTAYDSRKSYVASVTNCEFKNWFMASYNDMTLINEYAYYKSLFGRDKDTLGVTYSSCKGLGRENISKKGVTDNYTLREKTDTGEIIGANLNIAKNLYNVSRTQVISEQYNSADEIKQNKIDEDITQPEFSFLMKIENVNSIPEKGIGTTGLIEKGTIKLNDEVEILRNEKHLKNVIVIGLKKINPALANIGSIGSAMGGIMGTGFLGSLLGEVNIESAKEGENVEIILKGVQEGEIKKGDIICIK